jgi:hypothetical protein
MVPKPRNGPDKRIKGHLLEEDEYVCQKSKRAMNSIKGRMHDEVCRPRPLFAYCFKQRVPYAPHPFVGAGLGAGSVVAP